MNNLKDELDLIDKKSSKFKFFPQIIAVILIILILSFLMNIQNSASKLNLERELLSQEEIAYDLLSKNKKLLKEIDKLEKNHNNFDANSKKKINELEKRLKDSESLISSLKTKINDKEKIIKSLNVKMNEKNLSKPLKVEKTPTSSSEPIVKFIPYDDPPRPLFPIRPVYPNIAQEAGIEGQVLIQCFIDKNGTVKETIVLKGIPNTGLNEAAIDAIRKTRFRPAKQRDKEVGVWITIPINFSLRN
tara:strand:- start:227 stop:964 length:738 start_codon:yes stop_codon:yes gene_type:complete